MADEPVQVEVLDQDGRPLLPAKRKTQGSLLTIPLNIFIAMCALVAAAGILFIAVGTVLKERARGLGRDDKGSE
jgi:hypothetical protein